MVASNVQANIEDNLYLFFDDIRTEYTNTCGNLRRINSKDQNVLYDIKSYAVEILDLSHRICKKAIIHYPHTTLTFLIIAIAVNTVCTIIFSSLTAFVALGLDLAYAIKFGKLMNRALQIYDTLNICDEWTVPVEGKRAIIAAISPKEIAISLALRAKNFFSEIFNF